MKKNYLIISFLSIFLISCNDTVENSESVPQVTARSYVNPSENIYFNWESITTITLNNSPVTLPWYSGASGVIPTYILDDYTKKEGWEMVYNFCSPVPNIGYNSLIFYNKLTGRLRYFVHSPSESKGSTAFLAFECADNPTLLNFAHENFALDQKGMNTAYTTNITAVPTAIAKGWNCFEVELAYDPTINANKASRMRFMFYDQIVQKVAISGDILLNSDGTFTTTSSSSPSNILKDGFNSIVNVAGKEAETLVSGLFDKKENKPVQAPNTTKGTNAIIGPILGNIASQVIGKGMNFLTDSWFSKQSKTTEIISKIELKAKGKITLNGEITSNTGSNIGSPGRLVVPGSLPANEVILPLYNQPLGAWSLKKTPLVSIDEKMTPVIRYISPDEYENAQNKSNDAYLANGTESPYDFTYYTIDYKRDVEYSEIGRSDIVINPVTLACISKYEVSVEYFPIKKQSVNYLPPSYNSALRMYFQEADKTLYSPYLGYTVELEEGTVMHKTLLSDYEKNYGGRDLKTGYKNIKVFENLDFIAKVTLRMYPKSPYNEDVIVMTKTFNANKENRVVQEYPLILYP